MITGLYRCCHSATRVSPIFHESVSRGTREIGAGQSTAEHSIIAIQRAATLLCEVWHGEAVWQPGISTLTASTLHLVLLHLCHTVTSALGDLGSSAARGPPALEIPPPVSPRCPRFGGSSYRNSSVVCGPALYVCAVSQCTCLT